MQEIKFITLDCLLPGEGGIVQGYSEAQDLHHRLKELGLVAGTRIRVRRCAPLGDPMELSIRGYHLSIRKQDAKCILIEKDEGSLGPGSCGRGRHRHRGGELTKGDSGLVPRLAFINFLLEASAAL